MKNSPITVNPELRNIPNAQGLCRIRIRITQNSKHTYESTDLPPISKSDWTGKFNDWVSNKHPNHVIFNKTIRNLIVLYEKRILDFKLENSLLTKENLITKIIPEIKSYEDKNGERQIVIRITQNGKHIWKKTPYKIKLTEWGGSYKNWVNKIHPNYKFLNLEIEREINKYKNLKNETIKGNFLSFWDEVSLNFKPNHLKGFGTTKNKIIKFVKKNELNFSEINEEWLNNFEADLLKEKLGYGTIETHIKHIKCVWRLAIKNKLISMEKYPFYDKIFNLNGYKTNKV